MSLVDELDRCSHDTPSATHGPFAPMARRCRSVDFQGDDMFKAIRTALVGATVAAWCAIAAAQPVRGTIETVDGNVLTLKSNAGAELKLTLTENAMIVAVVKASMADIKEGTYLGSAAIPQPDGSQKALEVHIFPEQMRGTGEGHRPYAPVPSGTMTNGTMSRSAMTGGAMTNGATSGSTVAGVDGSATIVVKYKDGEQKIVIAPNVPIVRYEIGSQADLKPGARFTVGAATKKPDGTLEANRINVGREGVVPQ